jgi:monoamine oxidase
MDLSGAALNYRQKAALRSLQYGSATKIGVKFKSAWWQNDALMRRYGAFGAIIGGQSYTDYMSRMVVYPSYGVDTDTPSTVLIASYSWTKDALAWTGLMGGDADAKHAIKRIILQDLVAVHRFNAEGAAFLEDQWVDMFPHSWVTDPNTMGKCFLTLNATRH